MRPELKTLIAFAWGVLGLIWVVTALRSKRTVRRQSPSSRTLHVLLLVLAMALLFEPWMNIGPLGLLLIPNNRPSAAIGALCLLFGFYVAIWARFYLGKNWSANVTIKEDHHLVRSGPYAFVRHPIYSGLLLMIAGTAIATGRLRCFVAFLIALGSWHAKSRTEEAFLAEQCPADYLRYRQEVKALIPFLL